MDIEPQVGSLRDELSRTARGELSRQRGRLGNLTPAQETAIETLLISTTDRISDLLIRKIQHSSEAAEKAQDEI